MCYAGIRDRKGRGTRNQIANIRWIIEKAREFQKSIYFCFIDYAKAFDCVDLPGSFVQGILQARILEWVVIAFSRGCSGRCARRHGGRGHAGAARPPLGPGAAAPGAAGTPPEGGEKSHSLGVAPPSPSHLERAVGAAQRGCSGSPGDHGGRRGCKSRVHLVLPWPLAPRRASMGPA